MAEIQNYTPLIYTDISKESLHPPITDSQDTEKLSPWIDTGIRVAVEEDKQDPSNRITHRVYIHEHPVGEVKVEDIYQKTVFATMLLIPSLPEVYKDVPETVADYVVKTRNLGDVASIFRKQEIHSGVKEDDNAEDKEPRERNADYYEVVKSHRGAQTFTEFKLFEGDMTQIQFLAVMTLAGNNLPED